MLFPPSLLDEIRARLPVSQVVARKVKLKRQGREFAGLSPFKVEKTPSFFVNDHKGFYHCFASGEHGDIFTFVMKIEGLSFPEAVERLAGEAGVAMPKTTPRMAEAYDQRSRLYALVELATTLFEAELFKPQGREALRYAESRGLSRETIKQFRLGYALHGRSNLKEQLAKAGFTQEEMVQSGMLIHGPDIPVSYDRFRHRLMFPITDLKDRVIAFGGRALEKDAKPKYLNSPETPLFHKGAMLFNAAKARTAAHDRGQVIAVEGYMDAIALFQAGFHETVAPLGTALTPEQLGLMWRLCPEPTLCFDGDSAGQRAAFRVIETALPHLKPGQSLKFAFLADGLDPDDLIRQSGAGAMSSVLARAKPFSEVLWEREWGAADWSTPERRSQLEQTLNTLVARIEHPSLRSHYQQDIRARLYRAFGGRSASHRSGAGHGGQRHGRPSNPAFRQDTREGLGNGAPGRGRPANPGLAGRFGAAAGNRIQPVTSSLRQSRLVVSEQAEPGYREALLMRALLNHPWLIDDHAEGIAAMPLQTPAFARLRDAILEAHALISPLDRLQLRDQLTGLEQDRALTLIDRILTHRSDKFAEPDASREVVDVGWRHTLTLHERQLEVKRELNAAEKAWFADGSDSAFARLRDLDRSLTEVEPKDG